MLFRRGLITVVSVALVVATLEYQAPHASARTAIAVALAIGMLAAAYSRGPGR